ncbi:MAG: 50S ribosomal protein L19e [Candidatus Pacearchaeota archaeon]
MKLDKKKELASRVLKAGKHRIQFNINHLAEIKEAITKQDIRDLHSEGIIVVKPIKGRKKIVKRKTRRGPGKIRKTIKKRKQNYVKLTRKLRAYVLALKNTGKITREQYIDARKKIKMKAFRSKAHLKEVMEIK